jgi:hypothetical protein
MSNYSNRCSRCRQFYNFISTDNELCPICNAIVYDYQHGREENK